MLYLMGCRYYKGILLVGGLFSGSPIFVNSQVGALGNKGLGRVRV